MAWLVVGIASFFPTRPAVAANATRLWQTGFELQSVTSGVELATVTGSPTIDTTTKRSGAASLRCNPTAATGFFTQSYSASLPAADIYIRFYLYIATAPDELDTIFHATAAGTGTAASIKLNTDRTLELWDEVGTPAQVGSDSSALSTGTWYRIEVYFDGNGAGDLSAATARIDGTDFATGTITGAPNQPHSFSLGCITSTTADLYFDDVAANDDTGSASSHWPGEGKIVHALPNAAGDDNPNTGSYADADEVTPDDNTSHFILNTNNDPADVNIQSSSDAGIGSSDTITLVAVGWRSARSASGSSSSKARLKSQSSGTVVESINNNPSIQPDYSTNRANAPLGVYLLVSYTDPQAGGTWTPTLIDTAQIGAVAADASPTIRVTTIWASIEYIEDAGNTAPDNPTSLAQKKTDDTTIATGDWINATSVKFTATATDPDASDTLELCVEKDILGTSFSNTEDSCGTGVSYTGTGVTVTVTITGITDASEYHWQARIKDAGGLFSSWVSYPTPTPNAESARDFGIDTTAPTSGAVYDGTNTGVDEDFNDGSLSALSANWASFNSDVSGLNKYQYSIGTTAGGTDVKGWTDNSTNTSVTASSLALDTSKLYYFNVRAVDNAGNTQSPVVSSDGQMVAPSLSFSVSSTSMTFADLVSTSSPAFTDGDDNGDARKTTLTTSTNAYNGYVVRAFITDLLRSIDTLHTIASFGGGTYGSPDSWQSGDTGFGYTSTDTSVQGSNIFQVDPCPGGSGLGSSLGCFAPFNQTGPGDIVADHTAVVSGTPISNETFDIKYRVTIDFSQHAKTYSTTVIYTNTPMY